MGNNVNEPDLRCGHLAPLSNDQWPPDLATVLAGFGGKLNVYRVMVHNPLLLQAWENLRNHVVRNNSLGVERAEVVILRAGIRLGSAYEWSHHVSRARACGMDDARISSIRGDTQDMTSEDAILAKSVDELFAESRLRPESLAQLTDLTGNEGVLDLMATVGFYSTLGFILNTFETPLDADVAHELSQKPLKG